jgi:hypothetical protein
VNQSLSNNTIRFAGASPVQPVRVSPIMVNRLQLEMVNRPGVTLQEPPPALPASLPLMSSQNGNLFVDRNDPKVHWYIPDFALAEDTDSGFAFTATQTGQGADGTPYNAAQLTLRVRKFKPDDVVRFEGSNHGAALHEIPLAEMVGVLTSVYTDNGAERQRTFNATIQDAGGGYSLLTFDAILGDSVAGLYQDLKLYGKGVLKLSAAYQGWSQQGTLVFAYRAEIVAMNRPAVMMAQPAAMRSVAMAPATTRLQSFGPGVAATRAPAQAPAPPTLIQSRQVWEKLLPLGVKYNQDGYQLKYTVETTVPPVPKHVILNVDDLRAFSKKQSEFTELKALGDISQRYPTLSRAYIGVYSRTIVVIPQRYSIVCSAAGCAALCVALVDSSAADGSKCKFEFDFTIAPEVSRIELAKLIQEVVRRKDLQDYTVKLPDFQHDNPPSTLMTAFKSNVAFGPGTYPHSFSVTVSIYDDGSQSPAVANANLFISRLCLGTGTDLIGSLSLKLDDGYPDPVLSTIDLNFAHTAHSDVIVVEIEDTSAQIKLTNESSLDIRLAGYALILPVPNASTDGKGVQSFAITEVPDSVALPAKGSLSVPLPPDHTGLTLAADAQLAVPAPMTKADIGRFLNFQTADVQETQYVVAVNGAGVDFNKVDSIQASITFSTLPNVAPRPLSLNKNVHADSTHIVIPLENAVFSLPGTVSLAVHFADPGTKDLVFTVENDFTGEPVLILLQSAIDQAMPKP